MRPSPFLVACPGEPRTTEIPQTDAIFARLQEVNPEADQADNVKKAMALINGTGGVTADPKKGVDQLKKAADAGKCLDTAMKEVKLPKYEKWANYETGLPANVERFCYWWGRGY